ncbi:sensor histidine kinase CpxA [Abditibacteriota bacterium]|nr:sensor histidine kinase CpxA [Abditibacteriota bacterium]
MKTLFAKIFLWFFVAQVLLGVAMFAVGFSGRDAETPGPVQQLLTSELRLASSGAVVLAQRGKLDHPSANAPIRNWRTRVFWRRDEADWRYMGHRPPSEDERELLDQAVQTTDFVWTHNVSLWGGALAARTRDGQTVVVMRQIRRRTPLPLGFLDDLRRPERRVRFGVTLAIMALVCFGLARYLTLPVERLRVATHRLREGDLSARVGFKTRGDELITLGHDFDAMAERLEESAATERRLLGDISHELRSPLARLSVALDLVEQSRARAERTGQSLPEAKYIAALDRIRRESGVLNELIGQLLELSRLESLARDGLTLPAKEELHLETIVADVVADAQYEARGRGRDVELLENAPCPLSGVAALLRSALENVVRNAVRHTREGTHVEVTLTRTNNQGIITVRDYGPGVPEELLSSLFRPFYRVNEGRDRESGGVGLGLSIADRALRVHGATIEAHNVTDGGGLLVEIHIPLEPEPAREPQPTLASI